MPDLVELRRIAEAATPGEWTRSAFSRAMDEDFEDYAPISAPNWHGLAQVVVVVDHDPSEEGEANAAHIAAFNPSTALALLDQLERAREALRNLQEGAALALAVLPETGTVADFLAAIHRECVKGLIAADGVTNEAAIQGDQHG